MIQNIKTRIITGIQWLWKAITQIYTVERQTLYDCSIISILTVIISMIFNMSFTDPSSLFNLQDDELQISADLLFQVKACNTQTETSPIITIVDIGAITSRKQIAQLLDSVYEMSPKVIAVDLDFRLYQDSVSDRLLACTVDRVKDKAIFVCRLLNYDKSKNQFSTIGHSFFADPDVLEYYCDSVREAFANLKNNGDMSSVWKYSLREKVIGGSIYSLPAMMVDGLADNDVDGEEHIINYNPTHFNTLTPGNLRQEWIKDNYVFFGAIEHSGDKYQTTFGPMPGMLIHAQILQTELETDRIQILPSWGNFVLLITGTMLFIMLLVILDYSMEHTRYRLFAFFLQGGLMSLGLTFVTIWLLELLSYRLFVNHNIYAPMQQILNGILFIATGVKVVYSSFILYLTRHRKLQCLTQRSIYSKFHV